MGLWSKLKSGLKKTSTNFNEKLKKVFVHKKLDEDTLDAFEDMLIESDFGVETASHFRNILEKNKFDQEITEQELKEFLSVEIETILENVAKPLDVSDHKPFIVLVNGVNGVGKTTTIGKLANCYQEQGLKVEMAACDTFRAAAVDQLKVWADRLNVTCYTTKAEGDAAGLAFDAIKSAKEKGTDILFIDTAGRLHNKEGLMNELSKIGRVIKKVDETAPHASLLVLDATTGQNAHNQVREFDKAIPLTGLIMTKLDGTAKGGTLISLAQKFDLPIHALGVGEGLDDLKPFTPKDFSHSLLGL